MGTNPTKIEDMASWPTSKTLKALRGFLGLTGHYRRFIKSYNPISKLLTNLLKKNAFPWSEAVDTVFQDLKHIMITVPVLAPTNFTKTFAVETNACSKGIGVVLM